MGYQSAYKNSKIFQPQKFYAYDNTYMHEIASCCHVIILLLVTLELGFGFISALYCSYKIYISYS